MNMANDNESIGLKSIVVKYLLHWKLFLNMFVVSLVLALGYLMLYPKTYEIAALIQLQEEKEIGGGGFGLGEASGLMKSFGLGSMSNGAINMKDELMTLTSNNLIKEMILELGIHVAYTKPYSFYRIYKPSVVLTADTHTNQRLNEIIDFTIRPNNAKTTIQTASSNGSQTFEFASLPAKIELPQGVFTLDYAPGDAPKIEALNIQYKPAGWVAEDLVKELLVEESSKTSNVIELSCTDYEAERGVDMLSVLIQQYNKQASQYKNVEAEKTLSFLDGRIVEITTNLSEIEQKIEDYKFANKLTDIENDVKFYSEQMKELLLKSIELETQSHVIQMMDAFVKDSINKYNLIPALLNTQEGEKGSSPIQAYNQVLLERSRVIQNSNVSNPLVGTLTQQADKLRESVFSTIENARVGIQLSMEDVRQKESQLKSKMTSYPAQERIYIDFKRQQEIYQGVYLILLQKREEVALSLGQGKDKARTLDQAYVKSKPIGPRKLYAAIGMIVFTLLLSIGYLFCKEQLLALIKAYKNAKNA